MQISCTQSIHIVKLIQLNISAIQLDNNNKA